MASCATSLYPQSEIHSAVIHLAQHEFIRDVLHQKPWPSSQDVQLAEEDKFIIAPAGGFLLTRLLSEFAFRYCEAMADVTARARRDGKPWDKARTPDALAFNAAGILELFVYSAEEELRSVLNSAGKTRTVRSAALQRLRAEYGDILTSMAEDCDTRSGYFLKEYEAAKDFEGMARLKNIHGTIVGMREKCARIQDGIAYV